MLMPDMDGIEALRTLKQTPSTSPYSRVGDQQSARKEWRQAHPRRGARILRKGLHDSGEIGAHHFWNLKKPLIGSLMGVRRGNGSCVPCCSTAGTAWAHFG